MYDRQKFLYLTSKYPKKRIGELAEMFEVPPIDFNVLIWQLRSDGVLKVNDKKGGVTVLEKTDPVGFGPEVEQLKDNIQYSLEQLAKQEGDIEENYLAGWCRGYKVHDIFIAINLLKDEGIIASYTLKDTTKDKKGKFIVDEYTFYTLKDNLGKEWGKKQFKDPETVK